MNSDEKAGRLERATLAGGCFWCVEAAFARLRGVHRVRSGYTGGAIPHPSYQAVCEGTTGHAEAVEIEFDPAVIAYGELLEVFFTVHDPTTLNRQGADVGTQYRSAIFYHSREQRAEAEAVIARFEAERIWPDPIVTELTPVVEFFPAEEYHNDYYSRNGAQPYCRAVIAPKLAKVRAKFRDKMIDQEAG